MIKIDYLQRRGLTPLEVRICISALIVTITLVVLVATDVVGSWALLVACVIAGAVSLMRYRAETEQKRRAADDQDE
jgi:Flp pilus assembly protein TadB